MLLVLLVYLFSVGISLVVISGCEITTGVVELNSTARILLVGMIPVFNIIVMISVLNSCMRKV